MTYRVLGTLEVERDGVPVAVSAAKPKALLLALLLRVGSVVSTDVLIDAIWPEAPPASAPKLVQIYVSQLRGLLGADAIETVGPGYRVEVAMDGHDALRFEALHADGRAALAGGRYAEASDTLDRASRLWRGPALADVVYTPFASHAAARLEELRVSCLEDRFAAELALGHEEEVLGELIELSREHPLRERLRERLALALYRSGRQAEALAVIADGRQILLEELGLDPSRELQDLEQAILAQDPALDLPSAQTQLAPSLPPLPVPANSLIGRHDELERLAAMVERDDVRIVTISGAGGSGKTRLAIELARSIAPAFADGAAMAQLAPVRDPNMVLTAIARSVGVPEAPDEPLAVALVRWLSTRELLLVIDTFEHVIDAASAVAALVRDAPGLTIVVTSRRVLHVAGEHVLPLAPLPPDDAVRLFAERATARDPDVRFGAAADDVLRAICTRLDCLPLAVELAAARTIALEPGVLLERLRSSMGALGIGPRDAPARQQTLADTVRWSTDLLSARERRAFARLSVFAGGCSLAAAEVVGDTDVDTIAALLDASLLTRTRSASGGARLVMLDTIRAHANTLLEQSGERADAEAAHGVHFAQLARSTPMKGVDAPSGLSVIDADLDNLRLAHDRAIAAGDDDAALAIAVPLYRYWYPRGLFREGLERIRGPLDRGAGHPALRADALRGAAGLEYLLGADDASIASATDGIEQGQAAGHLEAVLGCHTVLGLVAERRGELAEARVHLERSRALAVQLGLELDVVIADTNLAEVALQAGDLDEARRRFDLSIELNRAVGGNSSYALLGSGDVATRQGRFDDAVHAYQEAHDLAVSSGIPHNVAMAVLGLASVSAHQGHVDEASRLLGRATAMAATTAGGLHGIDGETYRETEAIIVAAVGAARSAELIAAGAADVTTSSGARSRSSSG